MQTVGTPITTTTVAGSESAAISATSATPAAPFDAVMALMTQVSTDPAAAIVSAPANGLAPVQPVSADGIPTVFPAFSAAAPSQDPAVTMVSPRVVNAAAPADETGLDALLAATALAGRGITARPPAPPAQAASIPSDIPPEDFIGPVKPSVLTADAAAPSGVAARPQEFAVANAAIDPEFIGPMRPADWQDASADVVAVADAVAADGAASADASIAEADRDAAHLTDDLRADDQVVADDLAADLASQPPLGADRVASAPMQDVPVAVAAEDVLPEAEALLQRKEESSENEQPLVSSMASSLAQADAVTPTPSRVTGATAERDILAVHAALAASMPNKAVAPTPQAAEDETFATETEGVSSASHREASHQDDASQDDRAPEMEMSARPDLVVMMAATINPFIATTPSQEITAQRQANAAIDDVTSAPRNGLPPAVALAPRQQDLVAMAPRDAALLQTMTAMSQPRGKSEIRGTAPVITTNSAFMPIETPAFAPERPTPDARALAASDEARRLDLPVDHVSRDRLTSEMTRSAIEPVDTNALDPKLSAMVHGVTVSGSAADDQLAATSAPAINAMTAAPQTPTLATVSRDAPLVSAVVADGRRDTQRDAEIRERQIKNQVTAALRAGQQEVRMQLYPPGLGQILIRIAMDGGKLRLSMKAASSEATEALVQTETGLRDALSRDGFALASFDVHDDNEKGRNSRQQVEPATTMNHATAEGEAFSVDMTA